MYIYLFFIYQVTKPWGQNGDSKSYLYELPILALVSLLKRKKKQ